MLKARASLFLRARACPEHVLALWGYSHSRGTRLSAHTLDTTESSLSAKLGNAPPLTTVCACYVLAGASGTEPPDAVRCKLCLGKACLALVSEPRHTHPHTQTSCPLPPLTPSIPTHTHTHTFWL